MKPSSTICGYCGLFFAAIFILANFESIGQTIPTNGLAAFYPLDGNAFDQGVNNLHGTVLGATPTTDRFGNPNRAMHFDGVNDQINLPNSPALKPQLPFSISIWIKPDTFAQANIGIFRNDQNNGFHSGFWLSYSPTSPTMNGGYGDGTGGGPSDRRAIRSVVNITTGWHHVVFVCRGPTDMDLYIDGTKDDNAVYSGTGGAIQYFNGIPGLGYTFSSGPTGTRFFRGAIDDFAIYDVALRECDVHQLYSNLDYELIGKYPFNGNAMDTGPFGMHGTVVGATLTNDRFGNPNSAYFFDGINDQIILPNDPVLKPQLPFSASFWTKIEDFGPTWNGFFSNNQLSGVHSGISVFYNVNARQLRANVGDGAGAGPSNRRTVHGSMPLDTTWKHVVFVCRGPLEMELYLNGVKDLGKSYQGSGGALYYSNSNAGIGYRFGSSTLWFYGVLDDFTFFNRSLSDCEALELYEGESFEGIDSLIQVCPFDTLDLSSSITNPDWYVDGVFQMSGSTFSLQVNSSSVVAAIGQKECVCDAVDSFEVILSPPPAYVLPDTFFVCPETTETLNLNLLGPGSVYWEEDTLFQNPGSVSPTLFPISNPGPSPIFRTIILTVFDSTNSCSHTDSAVLTVYPEFPINAGPDTFLCADQALTELGDTTSQNGFSFSWNGNPSTGLLSSTIIANPIFSFQNDSSSNQEFDYTLSKTNILTGCVGYDSIKIVVNRALNTEAGMDTIICSQERIQIGNLPDTIFQYTWLDGSNLSDSLISDPFFLFLNADSQAVTHLKILEVIEVSTGCTSRDSIQIEIKPQVFVDAGPDISLCGSDTITIGKTNNPHYVFSWSPALGVVSTNSDSTKISLDNSSDSLIQIKYFLVAQYLGCIEKDSILVDLKPKPYDQISGPDVVCPMVDSAMYLASRSFTDYNYQWFVNGGSITSSFNDSVFVSWDSTNAAASIGIIPINNFACTGDSFSWSVRINPLLRPEIEADTISICEREKNLVKYEIKYPINSSNYQWQVQNGSISIGQGSDQILVNWNGIGIGKLWVQEENITITDSCFGGSDTITVQILEDPVLDSIYGPDDICDFGDSIWYRSNSSLAGTFFWTSDSISRIIGSSNNDSILITTFSDGDFELASFIQTPYGCTSDTLSKVVNVRFLQIPIITSDTVHFCWEDSLLIDLGIQREFQNSVYQWGSIGGQVVEGQGDPDMTLFVPNPDTIKIFVDEINNTNQDTCFTFSDTFEIIVHPFPSSNQIIGTFDFCDDTDSVWFYANGDESSVYLWSTDTLSQFISGHNSDSVLLSLQADGDIDLNVVEYSQYGCYGDTLRETINMRYFHRPEILTDTLKICFWDSVLIDFSIKDEYDSSIYNWSSSNGTIVSGQGLENMTLKVTDPDTIFLFVEEVNFATEDTCFGSSDTIAIYLYPNPERGFDFLGNDTLCYEPDCIPFKYPGWTNSSFEWFTDANFCSPSITDSVLLRFVSTGEFFLSVLETSEFNCVGDTADLRIELFPNPNTEILDLDSIVCVSQQGPFSYQVQGLDLSTFHWQISGGQIEAGQLNDTISVLWTDTSDLSLSVLERSHVGCTTLELSFPLFNDNMAIDLDRLGHIDDFNNLDLNGRSNPPSFNPGNEIFLYSWKEGEASNLIDSIVHGPKSISFQLDSIYGQEINYFQLSAINTCGDTILSDVHNNIILNIEAKDEDNRFSFFWNPYEAWTNEVDYLIMEILPDGKLQAVSSTYGQSAEEILAHRLSEHCFFIEARNTSNSELYSWSNLNCKEVERRIEMPNTLTPNGDGLNDVLKIPNLWVYSEHDLRIFDRNGVSVYHSENYQNDWPQGEINPGVYYYHLRIQKDILQEYKGFIHILK